MQYIIRDDSAFRNVKSISILTLTNENILQLKAGLAIALFIENQKINIKSIELL